MNDLGSWALDSRYYEELIVMNDMNNSDSWAQGSWCSEQLKVVVNMNDYGLLA